MFRRSKMSRTHAILMGFLTFAATLMMCFFGFKYNGENAALQKEGVTVQGAIQDKTETHGRNSSYKLTYDFKANGSVASATDHVSSSDYAGVSIGQPVQVTYVKSNPTICKTEFSNDRDGKFMFIMAGVTFVACLIFLGGVALGRFV